MIKYNFRALKRGDASYPTRLQLHGNLRRVFDDVGRQLGVIFFEDWYKVKPADLLPSARSILVDHFDDDMFTALQFVYPERTWHRWLFRPVPCGYWESVENHRPFFDWLKEQLGISEPTSWYKLSLEDVIGHGGQGLLSYYNNSHIQALKAVYPEIQWQPWRFARVSKKYWNETEHHREFFDWIGKQMHFENFEDWYKITYQHIVNNGGRSILKYYNDSPSKAVESIYPEYKWELWRFGTVPKDFWKDDENHRQVLQWMEKKFSIMSPSGWHDVTYDRFTSQGGKRLVQQYNGSLMSLLRSMYPKETWNIQPWIINPSSKSQNLLYLRIRELIPSHLEVEQNAFLPLKMLKYQNTMRVMPLDVWIPSFNVAFEYQGLQHYHDTEFMGEHFHLQYSRDEEKRLICEYTDISLVRVPFWWNFDSAALKQILQSICFKSTAL